MKKHIIFDNYNVNDFKSVSEIERTLEYIDKYISEAENVSL